MMSRVLKLKEDITNEVLKRVTKMQDSEERAVSHHSPFFETSQASPLPSIASAMDHCRF